MTYDDAYWDIGVEKGKEMYARGMPRIATNPNLPYDPHDAGIAHGWGQAHRAAVKAARREAWLRQGGWKGALLRWLGRPTS